jgi:SAM-dependent methyltransferase
MYIKKCRNCSYKKFTDLISLGNLSFSGIFAKKITKNIPKAEISLILCNKCKLVQLKNKFNKKFLYGKNYGYRTGINKTMTDHVHSIVKKVERLSKIKKRNLVLDIGSNDGTLLNFYKKDLIRVGIDPIINKYKKFYSSIDYKLADFFSQKSINKLKLKKKFKIITALSMFYDLDNPNKFLMDIKKNLDKEGILILEHADLMCIVKNNLFDTICHEHVNYYSSKIIINMLQQNRLKLFDMEYNLINGGSCRYYICHEDCNKFTNEKNENKIAKFILRENKFKLELKTTYVNFLKRINIIKNTTISLIKNIIDKKKEIHGYGASTKGNILLQYFGLNNLLIRYIADRNPKKNNHFTPGTKIKIITEKLSRKFKPDYYFVLPWHFKNEILEREYRIINSGTKFIFPLPRLTIH